MKTYLDCIPCFFRQALDAARMAGADEAVQKEIVAALAARIPKFSLDTTPPEMGRDIYRLVSQITGMNDPYALVKEESNRRALELYPKLDDMVEQSSDKLLTALELSIVGNIIDYGVKGAFDIEKEIEKLFSAESKMIEQERKAIFDYQDFRDVLGKAKNVLFIGDNAGEIVFDRVLLRQIKATLPADGPLTYSVREKPIINDALYQDAKMCGIDEFARIVSSGTDAPGTLLKECSSEFLSLYHHADMIVSKGQGNFEALNNEPGPIFFLFRAKCQVVARHIGCNLGDIILKRSTRMK